MKRHNFWKLFVISSIVWYLGISFIRWEIDWAKHLQDLTNMNRFWFFLGLIGKTTLDYILWLYLNKFEDRPEEKQRTYHYDENGNDITNKTSIN